jgi:hypothetical protein
MPKRHAPFPAKSDAGHALDADARPSRKAKAMFVRRSLLAFYTLLGAWIRRQSRAPDRFSSLALGVLKATHTP